MSDDNVRWIVNTADKSIRRGILVRETDTHWILTGSRMTRKTPSCRIFDDCEVAEKWLSMQTNK